MRTSVDKPVATRSSLMRTESCLAREATVMAGPRSHRIFPGKADQLSFLRQWLTARWPDCAALADVLSVTTELASNAIRHTRSGQNGFFAVEIIHAQKTVRVTVADSGAEGAPRIIDDPDGETGRGLLLVSILALETGLSGDCDGRLIWADIQCEGPA
jgi:anti-sigma regulatory factor (Ser/Thr protein kinase)